MSSGSTEADRRRTASSWPRSGRARRGSRRPVSVATEAGQRGVGNAAAADAGVDRLFLMGYDYHWSRLAARRELADRPTRRPVDLRWSIAAYVEAGVPRDRILLGLPLYGMTWRTEGRIASSPVVGNGSRLDPEPALDRLARPRVPAVPRPHRARGVLRRPGRRRVAPHLLRLPATLPLKLASLATRGSPARASGRSATSAACRPTSTSCRLPRRLGWRARSHRRGLREPAVARQRRLTDCRGRRLSVSL